MEKGRAAIEFLLTYGWILLVFLTAIGALLYFGYLSPETFSREYCEITPGLECSVVKATSEEIALGITNAMGQDIFIKEMQENTGKCFSKEGTALKNKEHKTVTLSECSNGRKGDRIRTEIEVRYQTSTGTEHTETALIATNLD